ncbi:hypothetical protein NPS01_14310 [Nocardioides psychrotolerans]|uniref:SurA N-terminal domain-containing protein n=1 Tax=Nocardioides psychrotolerans TaxID=1005945 RepID=A0A1I3H3D2_9ACTN|nr:hypothetical protein [Nocardioides psychrotolerans]GEP37768.1 hypothetical protein NPS01_14310 [Nocardioides psychrotolerans]SFI30062.1 hypothetical protein SAMN05216561_10714 [Nocardioides psychrotolerans]
MSTTRRRRTLARSVAGVSVAALALGLTGCGVAGTGFRPGIAAEVGDRTVSTDEVDTLVSTYCSAIDDILAEQSQVVPLSVFRSGIAGQLALVSAAEQLADDYGVEPADDYQRAVTEIEKQIGDFSESEQEAVVQVEGAATYVAAVQLSVGEQILLDEGVTEPGPTEAGERGLAAFTTWLDDNGAELNPEYGISVDGAAINTDDQSVSLAVGETALQGMAEEPDPAYAASLPDSQRCG